MPDKIGRFQLYSDTSKNAMGSVLKSNSEWRTQVDCICKQEITRGST